MIFFFWISPSPYSAYFAACMVIGLVLFLIGVMNGNYSLIMVGQVIIALASIAMLLMSIFGTKT
ncbi:MAG: hypothetical protein M1114_02365 [Candidatus Dependentiae bacterium]|nr:hypothetical protein [Candidatus Dependentiae bacterium]